MRDALDSTQMYKGNIPLSKLGATWTHENTSQFATYSQTDEITTINIYELQPTSAPPLHTLTSFLVPNQSGIFSFSPVSSHASFVTGKEVTILDAQNSKVLLQTQAACEYPPQGQFSPDGCFFCMQKIR